MRLTVLALDGVFDTGLSVLLDTFSTANELASAQGIARPLLDVTLVGVRRHIRTALGMSATVEPANKVRRADWVVVPALNAKQPERLVEALGRRDVLDAMAHLRTWHAGGIGVASYDECRAFQIGTGHGAAKRPDRGQRLGADPVRIVFEIDLQIDLWLVLDDGGDLFAFAER